MQLFEGEKIRFAAFDSDKDAEVFSKWTHDPEYMRLIEAEAVRPLAPFHIKKKFEEMEKESQRGFYYFVIHTKQDDRVIGFAQIKWIEWNHGNACRILALVHPTTAAKGMAQKRCKWSCVMRSRN